MTKIGFIGAGRMGSALIKAMTPLASTVLVSDEEQGHDTSNVEVVKGSDVVFICVKPQHVKEVLDEINEAVDQQVVVSIAAGITLRALEKALPGKKVVRVMPNQPCVVCEMAAAYSLGEEVDAEEGKIVADLLNSAGVALEVKEKDLDAVTGLSGSGPAFFAYVLQGFIEAGKKQGLSEEVATKLAVQTALGTAKQLQEGISPQELMDMVTSPGGTTEAGRKILETSDVQKVLEETVAAATKKSKELGT